MRRGAKICLTLRVVVRQSLILGQAVLALATVGPPLTVTPKRLEVRSASLGLTDY
jgi:hypothetical protein